MALDNTTGFLDVSDITNEGITTIAGMNETDPHDYYMYNDEYYYDDDEPLWLETFWFELIPLGYVRPLLVILTTMANIFVVGFFMKKKIRGRSTNLLFISIAVSDTMTGVMMLPNSFYVYMERHDELTRDWCNVYMRTKFYVSRAFHTVSVWQTVLLCIQRYMCVCHPFISGRVCTTRKTFAAIVIMYCLAFALHVYHAIEVYVSEVPPVCRWESETTCTGTCVYLWFCAVLQHVVPCIILLSLTIITLKELRKASRRVSSMSHRSTHNRSSRDRIITITSTLVVVVFLIPELPHGIYKFVLAVNAHEHLGLHEDTKTNHLILTIYELVLLVSFHANFWIYCSMMHDFRHALLKMVTCGAVKRRLSRIRTFSGSMSSRKNSVNTTVSRTSSVVSRNRILSQTTSIHSMGSDTLHAVIPLSPTKVRTNGLCRGDSVEEQNDDVFV